MATREWDRRSLKFIKSHQSLQTVDEKKIRGWEDDDEMGENETK